MDDPAKISFDQKELQMLCNLLEKEMGKTATSKTMERLLRKIKLELSGFNQNKDQH